MMDWKTSVREGGSYVREKPLRVVIALAVIVGIFLAGSWQGQGKAAKTDPKDRKVLYYVDPMNPAHTSPEPGLAPCGMKMEPVYAEGEGQSSSSSSLPAGTIKVSPEKQQIIGVRLDQVTKAPYTYMLRTLGRVTVDENRIYLFTAGLAGWVLETYGGTTGSVVQKDEPLASIYSQEIPAAQQSLLFAYRSLKRAEASGMKVPESEKDNLSLYEFNLKKLGMSELQIREIENTQQISNTITLRPPSTSFVIARNMFQGQQYDRGAEWFRLADLGQVWIQADLYSREARFVKAGEKVRVSSPYQDEAFQATVSQIPPIFDPATQSMKFRLESANPGYLLRPGMFVDVEFPINLPPAVTVPADAVLDSGQKQTVFVDRGKGFFEPRKVEIGWRLGDRVEILKGLTPGERIVVSGNFLLDSESRMRLAAAGLFGEVAQDPVCGMNLDVTKAKAGGYNTDYRGQPYYFCSEQCQKKFLQTPERYMSPAAPAAPPGLTGPTHPGVTPASPPAATPTPSTGPQPPMVHHGPTQAAPPAAPPAAPAAPPGPTVPMHHGGTPASPPATTQTAPAGPHPSMVHPGAAPVSPPSATPMAPAGPHSPMVPPGATPAAPKAMPPVGAQVTPPARTPMKPLTPTMVMPTVISPTIGPNERIPSPRPSKPQTPQAASPQPPQAPQPASPASPHSHEGHRHD